MEKEFYENQKNGMAYDFIANNYYKMRQDELKDILLEYIYTLENALDDMERTAYDKDTATKIRKELDTNLQERLNLED